MMEGSRSSGESWLAATYLPVSLFSLKSALATSSGGKTVLVPTPFAIKMALLDVAIRTQGLPEGERLFPLLRDVRIALHVPPALVVQNGFGKVRRPFKSHGLSTDEQAAIERKRAQGQYPWFATIAYREYVQFGGPLELAFAAKEGADLMPVADLLPCINYLGRRGGFLQIAELPRQLDALPVDFRVLTDEVAQPYGANWILQTLDDCGPSLTFKQADIYSKASIKLGTDRILRHVPLPLRLARSSRSFSLYTRIDSPS